MTKDKIKINSSLEKIKNDFFSISQTNIIYQNRVTRKGIAIKTVFLLLLSALSAMTVFYFLSSSPVSQELSILTRSISFFVFCSSVTIISYAWGVNSASSAKKCSFFFSIFDGISIGLFLDILRISFGSLALQLGALALFATLLIFLIVSYLYYKGSLVLSANSPLVKNMSLIFLVLFGVEIFYFCVLLLSGFADNFFSAFFHTFLVIPINLFVISFSVVILILHFNYVEDMVMNSMPKKYEWQLSLVFVFLFISIFIRILEILVRLIGFFSDKGRR